MAIQALLKPDDTLLAFLLHADPEFKRPIRDSPKELGYEIDEEVVAAEMLAQLRCSPIVQTTPVVDPEEFESIYQWFLS